MATPTGDLNLSGDWSRGMSLLVNDLAPVLETRGDIWRGVPIISTK